MKKLLIVGGNHSDIPLIESSKKLGYHVITTGNNHNGMGHKYANETYLEDISNKDAILNLAKKLNVDVIVPGCNDFAIITASYVNEQLKLNGCYDSYETTLILHHKDKFKQFAILNNLLVPDSISFDNKKLAINSIDSLQYPSIVKPIDLTGGKGITKINNKDEAIEAINKAFNISRAKKIVIDDFFYGSLHSLSTIIKNQKVIFYFGDNEYSYKNQYLVSTSTSLSNDFNCVYKLLIDETQKLASLLKLADGILHMQYLKDESNNIKLIEFTRRMPGDLYYKPVLYSTGLDYSMPIVKAYCGLPFEDTFNFIQKGFYSRHCIMGKRNGIINDVIYDESIQKNIIDKFLWWEKGDNIKHFMTYKAGIIFLKYDSEEDMKLKTLHINDLIKIDLV
jgi:biotin carboxylase